MNINEKTGIRQRKFRKNVTDIVRELDSFPKMPADFKQHTTVGGLMTLLTCLFLLWLVLSEIMYYRQSRAFNKFVPDVDFNDKLEIILDMTVAMRCEEIGADIVDVTNQESKKFGKFKLENTWFELSPSQKVHFEEIRRWNSYLCERYHSLRDILWRSGYKRFFRDMPPREDKPQQPFDACRITGELELNKVAGNLHITLGKSLSVPGGHVHLQNLFPTQSANFSHRIDRFYFGDPGPAMLQPLDSSMKVAFNSSEIYKYFIEVVSTDVDTSKTKVKTFQYSVKEMSKFTGQQPHSHEMVGIFFKYDINPLKIIIREEEYTLLQLILKIFGCAGGLYIVAGLINRIFVATIRRRYDKVVANLAATDKEATRPDDI